MRSDRLLAPALLAVLLHPPSAVAQQQPLPPRETAGSSTLLNGTTETPPFGDWNGTYQNSGVNLQAARRTRDGFLVRVKRLIKPGSDGAKEFARSIPIVSSVFNLATLGLYKRVLRSDGEAMRATWLVMNCTNKTFNVAGDGYAWQNIYKDQYGQAEDLYYYFCDASTAGVPPRYLGLPPADTDMLRDAQAAR